MKCLLSWVMIFYVSYAQSSFASMIKEKDAEKSGWIFERLIGSESKSAVIKTCSVTSGVGSKFEKAAKLFAEIKDLPITESMHIVAREPSIHYRASLNSKSTLIYYDHEMVKTRQGEKTMKLTQLIDEMCADYDAKR